MQPHVQQGLMYCVSWHTTSISKIKFYDFCHTSPCVGLSAGLCQIQNLSPVFPIWRTKQHWLTELHSRCYLHISCTVVCLPFHFYNTSVAGYVVDLQCMCLAKAYFLELGTSAKGWGGGTNLIYDHLHKSVLVRKVCLSTWATFHVFQFRVPVCTGRPILREICFFVTKAKVVEKTFTDTRRNNERKRGEWLKLAYSFVKTVCIYKLLEYA